MTTIDYTIIGLYLVFIFIIGIFAGRKIEDIQEYAVAKRSYSAWVLFATLSASFIGGGFSFGNADTVFNQGLILATALWGFSLMLILVAKFIAPNVRSFRDCISVGDIIHKSFGRSGRIVSGILGTMVCIGILGAQIGAIGAVFAQFTSLNFLHGALLGCGIVIIYTALGGIRAVIVTDVIQFIFLAIFIPLALILGIIYVGGFSGISEKVPAHFLDISFDNISPSVWISLFLTFLIGETLVPPYVQRLLITKTPEMTAKGTMLSGIVSIPFFLITGSIGIVALAINPDIPSNLAMPTVVEAALPVGIRGLACAAIISIVMSSADSFLNSASVCLMEDVIKPLVKRKIVFKTPKQDLVFIKILTLFIGIDSVCLALVISNVLDVLRFAYNFWAPVMLVPLVFLLMRKKVSTPAFWSSALAGASVVALAFICGEGRIFTFDAVVAGTFANLFILLIVNKLTVKENISV